MLRCFELNVLLGVTICSRQIIANGNVVIMSLSLALQVCCGDAR